MADATDAYNDSSTHSVDSHHEPVHIEPLYEAFLCPLTRKIMQYPVTLETGQTFERDAIERWLRECNINGKPPTCPVTKKVLNSTELNPSIALRNTIEEWTHRNEAARLDVARRSLYVESSEADALQALDYVIDICNMNRAHKNFARIGELIPLISDLLKSTSRRVRLKALETLRILAEEDDDNKENIAAGDTIRTIVKFLSHGHSLEREAAVSLLYELSKDVSLCEKIGDVSGAILILVGMSSSKSENLLTVEKAEKTLENLERFEKNVRQMAENGRLRPLLTLLLQGSPDTQLSMAAYLGELVLSNDVKIFVAETAGKTLVNVMKSGNKEAREAALKALNQISSYETSAKILIEGGILPPLVKDLFTVGSNQLPMRLKEVSATILANLVACGVNFDDIPLDHGRQSLVSEDIVHNLLHLISNTGPAIECKLLQVLVGLTSSSTTVSNIVSAIKSSGATISLIQFVEAPQQEVRMAAIKLLNNISPHMGQEMIDSFRAAGSQLTSLIDVIAEDINGISDEQAAAAGLLADLPERDSVLTQRLLEENAFMIIISKIIRIRQGEIRGGRFATPFLEGLVRILCRVTYMLDENTFIMFAREHNLAALFTELLQMSGLDKVQAVSAAALENLSQKSKFLTRILEPPEPNFCCFCFGKTTQDTSGICKIHHGFCSIRDTFCLLDGKAVEKLVALLDHTKLTVVEASLAALCTLLEDGVDIEEGVIVLCDAEGIRPILEILCENRSEALRQRAVWAVERILRREDIAYDISGDQNVGTALVEAFRNGDYRTRQIAERALKHVDKLPNFSGIFTKMSST